MGVQNQGGSKDNIERYKTRFVAKGIHSNM